MRAGIGGWVRDPRVRVVVSAYFDIITEAATPAAARELAIGVANIVTVGDLFAVGRAVRDAQPWVPFLKCLRSATTVRDARAVAAERRLYSAASEMLQMQGLGRVRPEDCLARPTPFEEAFASLISNTI